MNDNRHFIFQTPIWGYILNDQKYQVKDYIEAISHLEQTVPSERKSNVGGYQTHDNLHQLPVFKEFVEHLQCMGSNLYSEHSGKQGNAVVTEMWGNINNKYCYNAAHIHGQALSGVFYLQVPPNSGNLIFCNPAVRSDGRLFRNPNYTVAPENLACIIFPSWLEHYVEPNLSDQQRISISFNMRIES